jgi:three-Cys-motif partner protein
LNYIDGFSGPWQSQDEALSDTSPHLAIRALAGARDVLLRKQRPGIRPRAFFVEEQRENHRRLADSLATVTDLEHSAHCGRFEGLISEAVQFATSGSDPFAFIFIDPTGWTGFELETVKPLLLVERSEVLVNFMTKDIVRFIDKPDVANERSFIGLFGSMECRAKWSALRGNEREDGIVAAYCERLRVVGNFKHVVSAVVLNPAEDRTHYHLIYGTRHHEGLVTFRDAEDSALSVQKSLRADVKERKRRTKELTGTLFGAESVDTPYIEELHSRYLKKARDRALALRAPHTRMSFDEFAWSLMEVPMIAERDVKAILTELQIKRVLAIEGLEPRARVPQFGKCHQIRWA